MTTAEAAVLIGGCVVVPPELLAELHAELIAPRQAVPLDVVQPHRSPQMVALTGAVLAGAIAHNRATTRESDRKRATLSHPASVPPWKASASAGSLSMGGEVVGVAVAGVMLGFSLQWIRELARNGALPGARKIRGFGNGRGAAHTRWCIPLTSVHAYRADRRVT
jgi:hypothetical protein